MTITRNHNLTASGSMRRSADLNVRKANDGVTADQLAEAGKQNGRNEVVVKGNDDQLYVVDARRLGTDSFHQVKPGDSFELGGIRGKVVHTDLDADFKASPLGVAGTAIAGALGMEATGATLSALGVGAGAIGGMSAGLMVGMLAGGVGAAAFGAALFMSRRSDDSDLAQLTTTLAHDKQGDFDAVADQLQQGGV